MFHPSFVHVHIDTDNEPNIQIVFTKDKILHNGSNFNLIKKWT